MARLLYRIARFATRRRWAVLTVWLVALIGLGGAALGLHGTMADSFSIPGTPAQQAMDRLDQAMPTAGGATGRIVFAAPQGHTIDEPEYQQAISQLLTDTSTLPSVVGVVDPASSTSVSPDRRVALAQVHFAGQITEVPAATQQAIADLMAQHEVDGLTIAAGGAAVKQVPAIGSTEGIGVIVALVALLVTFGSVVAAGLPLLTALIGVGVGMAGILTVSSVVDMSSTAPILALMLGLAVGIDYALFIVSRHRRQLRDGMPVTESIARATGTAGSAVVFAGLTVVIALAALSVVGIPFLTIMGIAAAATVVTAVLIAITLVPALLAFAGQKVLRRKDRAAAVALRSGLEGPGRVADPAAVPDRPGTATVPDNRWIRLVARRPVAVLIAGVLALGVLAVPALSLHLGLPDDGVAAPDSTQRQAYDLIAESFGPGANGPLIVTVQPDDPAALQSALTSTAGAVSRMPGVVAAMPAGASPDATLGVLQVIPTTGPGDERTEQLVHTIRDAAPALGDSVRADIAVTGQTALQIDVSDKLADALPVYLAIVVGLALVLLLLVFRSIVVPVKAAVGFLLSVAVSFGAVVAVYQWGWLGALFGVHTPAPVISFLPILLIGVLFGLAMDYEVFLVSGMREAWVHGGDANAAVRHGFSAGSRVVTAAAIIMASVFCGFILAPDTIIASIGFALGVGVLVDAFVVRMTLVPAVMTLLGRKAWYLPRWLDRALPAVDIEGSALTRASEDRELQAAGA
ncbi:MAG TPA: MMPL family transporter [Nakamurella sp.]|nr:MMPL family transporter [Nakamurella sp.]